MLRRRWNDWNEKKFNRFLDEGRGQGTGKSYIPWIKVQDFSSKAGRKRIPGNTTGRLHHLFSNHEKNLLYVLDWADCVVDIREQFPLVDIELACRLAKEMGIKYPKNHLTKFPYVLTTDFRITITENGKQSDIGLTVKPSNEFKNSRVLEKFELERRYYLHMKTEWYPVTEKHIPLILANNIGYVRGNHQLEATEQKTVEELQKVSLILKNKLQSVRGEEVKVTKITNALDKELKLSSGTSLSLFKNLVAQKKVVLDMENSGIDKNCSTELIQEVVFN